MIVAVRGKAIHGVPRVAKSARVRRMCLITFLSKKRKEFNINAMEDWYKIPFTYIGPEMATYRHRTMYEVMSTAYPDHPWDQDKFVSKTTARQSRQRIMERAVDQIFPGFKTMRNCRSYVGLVTDKGVNLEIDYFIEDLNLAFEYQEPHHYFTSHFGQMTPQEHSDADMRKKDLAAKIGLTMIVVPFWWDNSALSLLASVLAVRPDLIDKIGLIKSDRFVHAPLKTLALLQDCLSTAEQDQFKAISIEPPPWILDQFNDDIPGFGLISLAVHLNPRHYPSNLNTWIILEKYDGVRSLWHPSLNYMYSRHGNILHLPDWIIENCPNMFLDGEMWFGRKTLHKALAVSSKSRFEYVDWDKFQYVVFDMPVTGNLMYRSRLDMVDSALPTQHPFIGIGQWAPCPQRDDAQATLDYLIEKGAEGFILRDGMSYYEHGLTRSLYKFKGFRDAEARVKIPERDGKVLVSIVDLKFPGRFLDMLMSMHPDFKETLREGDIVSYQYSVWRKYPEQAKIYQRRPDLTWEMVKQSQSSLIKPFVGGKAKMKVWKPPANRRTWRTLADQKEFLDAFAKSEGFDYTDARKWEDYSNTEIILQGGSGLIRHYGTLRRALEAVYPEVVCNIKIS